MYQRHLARWVARGVADGYMYLLICFDTFDAIKGDPDGGYYPVYVHTVEDVVAEIAARQSGEWLPTDARDFCEYVAELGAGETPELQAVPDWLRFQDLD